MTFMRPALLNAPLVSCRCLVRPKSLIPAPAGRVFGRPSSKKTYTKRATAAWDWIARQSSARVPPPILCTFSMTDRKRRGCGTPLGGAGIGGLAGGKKGAVIGAGAGAGAGALYTYKLRHRRHRRRRAQ